jgi:hypothetical protein
MQMVNKPYQHLRKPKVHYHLHKSTGTSTSTSNPMQIFTTHFLTINYNTGFPAGHFRTDLSSWPFINRDFNEVITLRQLIWSSKMGQLHYSILGARNNSNVRTLAYKNKGRKHTNITNVKEAVPPSRVTFSALFGQIQYRLQHIYCSLLSVIFRSY